MRMGHELAGRKMGIKAGRLIDVMIFGRTKWSQSENGFPLHALVDKHPPPTYYGPISARISSGIMRPTDEAVFSSKSPQPASSDCLGLRTARTDSHIHTWPGYNTYIYPHSSPYPYTDTNDRSYHYACATHSCADAYAHANANCYPGTYADRSTNRDSDAYTDRHTYSNATRAYLSYGRHQCCYGQTDQLPVGRQVCSQS